MDDTLSEAEKIEVLLGKQLKDALGQLNSATHHVQEVLQDHPSRTVPFLDNDYTLRQALRTETEERREYMRLARTLQDLVLHGKIPSDSDPKAMVMNSGSE
jgi:hypothetical protein